VLLQYVVPVTGIVCYYSMWYLLQGECVTTVCGTCYRESVLLQCVVTVTGRMCYYSVW
jgi:membrane protein YqaA with SNARE-associated domain